MKKSLTLKKITEVNYKRCRRWHQSEDLSDWSIQDWLCAAAGEMGEACNIGKKLKRLESKYPSKNDKGRQINSYNKAIKELGKEIADTFLYLNLVAIRCGLDMEKEVVNKFNEVSDKYGFPEKL